MRPPSRPAALSLSPPRAAQPSPASATSSARHTARVCSRPSRRNSAAASAPGSTDTRIIRSAASARGGRPSRATASRKARCSSGSRSASASPAVRASGGDVRLTDVVITHTGFAEPAAQQGKVDRNLRLLELELAERPGDAFVLYNFGAVALTRGRLQEALDYLTRSLGATGPSDGMAAKLHALRARCLHELGRKAEALAACRAGRSAFAADAELLFWEALLLDEAGNPDGAAAALEAILSLPPRHHFMSVDAGLRGYRTRHFLADVYRRQGRTAEAEAQWRAAVAERPDFGPAWRALAGLCHEQGRWAEMDEAARGLAQDPQATDEAELLRAQALLGRGDLAAARGLLEGLVARQPGALAPRVLLSHALLRAGTDWAEAEAALRGVLDLDPGHAEVRHNLSVLLRQLGRADELPPPTLEELYLRACNTPWDVHEHLPTPDVTPKRPLPPTPSPRRRLDRAAQAPAPTEVAAAPIPAAKGGSARRPVRRRSQKGSSSAPRRGRSSPSLRARAPHAPAWSAAPP